MVIDEVRTKSWRSQHKFDELISDTSISGLTFLKGKYESDLTEFRQTNDLSNDNVFCEYRQIQQRYKMINEELNNRMRMIENDNLYSKDIHFNTNYDIITKDDNGEIKVLRPSLDSSGEVDIIEIDEEDVRG